MMDIYQEIRVYGEERPAILSDRMEYLASRCSGKNALHVGCADAPLAVERVEAGQLLHQRIEKAAAEVVGIDIDEDSICFLQEHGIHSVQVMDAERMSFDRRFDVILAGDVLEHLSNPGLFLQQVPDLLLPGGELIVAVPHAFTFLAMRVWLQNKELVHKDHCFYYSPKCLAQLCRRYELLPTRLHYTVQPRSPGESRIYCAIRSLLTWMRPMLAPAFIMHFQHASTADQSRFRVLR